MVCFVGVCVVEGLLVLLKVEVWFLFFLDVDVGVVCVVRVDFIVICLFDLFKDVFVLIFLVEFVLF